MAALFCCAAPASAVAWNGNGVGGLQKQNVLESTDRYGLLPRASRIRLGHVARGRRCLLGRRAWEWSVGRCAVRIESATTEETTTKKKKVAKLYVKKIQTVPLPTFSDASGSPQHLRAFLREPEGRQCMLNTKALRKYEDVGGGAFKCYLPTMEFLSFEVAPVLDLLVDAQNDSCLVDMLSCRFEGSDVIRGQNERFSASMRNHLSWSIAEQDEEQREQYLHVLIELDVSLEVYTLPFTVLPISAVEGPGTLILQALVDRLIPIFVDQLFLDYRTWAEGRNCAGDVDRSPALQQEPRMEVNGSLRG